MALLAQASEAWPGGDRPATGPGAATLRTRRVRLLSGWGTPSSRCVEAVPPLVVVGAEQLLLPIPCLNGGLRCAEESAGRVAQRDGGSGHGHLRIEQRVARAAMAFRLSA
jgi:hypothetical protein